MKPDINKPSKKAVLDADILAIYLKEINETPLLSNHEEVELALRIQKGDKEAREHLLKANLRFVVNVAKKYQNQGLPLTDLISEGNIGLMRAIERFDVSKGYHFISYAVWWIRQAILKAIAEKTKMIRLPLNRMSELHQIEKMRESIHKTSEIEEIWEVAKSLDMDKKRVQDLLQISKDHISLDTPLYKDDENTSIVDEIVDSKTKSLEDQTIDEMLRSEMREFLKTLEKREAGIIELRFGLNGFKPLSLKEVGDSFGLTKERIRQIEKKVLRRLRETTAFSRFRAYA